jgi:hypothetical protein
LQSSFSISGPLARAAAAAAYHCFQRQQQQQLEAAAVSDSGVAAAATDVTASQSAKTMRRGALSFSLSLSWLLASRYQVCQIYKCMSHVSAKFFLTFYTRPFADSIPEAKMLTPNIGFRHHLSLSLSLSLVCGECG